MRSNGLGWRFRRLWMPRSFCRIAKEHRRFHSSSTKASAFDMPSKWCPSFFEADWYFLCAEQISRAFSAALSWGGPFPSSPATSEVVADCGLPQLDSSSSSSARWTGWQQKYFVFSESFTVIQGLVLWSRQYEENWMDKKQTASCYFFKLFLFFVNCQLFASPNYCTAAFCICWLDTRWSSKRDKTNKTFPTSLF